MLSADIPSRNRYTSESRETRVSPTRYWPSMSLMYSPGIRLPRNPWSHGEAAWRKRGWNTDGTAISGPCPGMDAPQDDRTERIFDYRRATRCLGKRRSCMGGRLVSGVFSEECGFTISFWIVRSEEHTSELQSLRHLVCRLLLEKKKKR